MGEGVVGRNSAGGGALGADLAVDGGDVPLHGADTEHQVIGNLGIAPAGGDQAETSTSRGERPSGKAGPTTAAVARGSGASI
jgi:hypothetical protein